MNTFFALPEQDVEFRIAVRLLGEDPPLDRQIVEELVGRPLQYSELQSLLNGHRDNVLKKAIERLEDEGVIQQGIDLASKQKTYSLTTLDGLALWRLNEMVANR